MKDYGPTIKVDKKAWVQLIGLILFAWIMLDLIEVSTRHDAEKMHGYSNALGQINEIKFHTNLATCHHVRFEN